MVWMDRKTAYEIVPQRWIIRCLKMYKISDGIIKFIERTRENSIVELTAGSRSLTEVKIQSGISQGDAHHHFCLWW